MPYELRTKSITTKDIESLKEPWLVTEQLKNFDSSYVVLNTMRGFGDSCYTRLCLEPLITELRKEGLEYFYVQTPLPQMFADRPYIRCVKPKNEDLRTQAKNWAREDLQHLYHTLPEQRPGLLKVNLDVNYFPRFGGDDHWTVAENMMMPVISGTHIALDLRRYPMVMSLPRWPVDLPEWSNHPFILLRPNVIRKEWPAYPRNCKPRYLKTAIHILKKKFNYPIVSIADADGHNEMIENDMPCDYAYHRGEFNLEQIMELVHRAFLCFGSQGFISGFSMGAKTNCIIILAGAGYENNPARLTHPKMDTSTVQFIVPDNLHMCRGYRCTQCDKNISNFDLKFANALNQLGID
jgi:hypothetical protein